MSIFSASQVVKDVVAKKWRGFKQQRRQLLVVSIAAYLFEMTIFALVGTLIWKSVEHQWTKGRIALILIAVGLPLSLGWAWAVLKLSRKSVASLVGQKETYKAWWNSAPTDYEAAKRNVYKTKDEEDFRKRGLAGDQQSWGAKQLIEVGKLAKEAVVLEIGCGVARIGREIAPYLKEWHGGDISSAMLEFARERTKHLSNVFFHELSGTGLGFAANESFDFIYCTIVFMHLDKEDMYEYIREAFRVLRPGGRAYFDTWNLLNDNMFRHFLQTQQGNRGDSKVRNRNQYSTPQEMLKYVTSVGFRTVGLIEGELIKIICEKPGREPTSDF